MTTKKTTTELRRCTGSARFGIEPHEAPISEFPKQPSRKDGLGTMCTEHWRAYVKGLREARKAARATGRDRRLTPRSAPSRRRSSGPGRESGAFLVPVGSGRHRAGSGAHVGPVAPTVETTTGVVFIRRGGSRWPCRPLRRRSPRRTRIRRRRAP